MEGEAYAREKLNIRANTPFPLWSKCSVQKGGGIFGSLRYIYLLYEIEKSTNQLTQGSPDHNHSVTAHVKVV